jgi:hypothetical protein
MRLRSQLGHQASPVVVRNDTTLADLTTGPWANHFGPTPATVEHYRFMHAQVISEFLYFDRMMIAEQVGLAPRPLVSG